MRRRAWLTLFLCVVVPGLVTVQRGLAGRVQRRSGSATLYLGLGHSDVLTALAWSPDGKTLATGSKDHTVILWDTTTWRPRATLAGPGPGVSTLVWGRDGGTLGSCDRDDAILWDAVTGRRLARLPDLFGAPVFSFLSDPEDGLAWSPNGRMVAASKDNSARLWDFASHRRLILSGLSGSGYHLLAWSPDSRTLAASDDRAILLWDTATGGRRGSLDVGVYATWAVWSPDGKTLASYTPNKGVALWDIATGKARGGEIAGWEPGYLLAWNPDGKFLATVAGEKSDDWIVLWDASTGKRLRGLAAGADTHSDSPRQLVWSPDGQRLAVSCDTETILWDARVGRHLATLESTQGPLAWSPDGTRFAVAPLHTDETAVVCDGRTGQREVTLARHLTPVSLARPAWFPHGTSIIATAGEGAASNAVRWDVQSGNLRSRMGGISEPWDPIRELRLSPDGRYVAAATGWLGYSDAGGITGVGAVWDARTGAFCLRFPGALGLVAWSPDSSLLATGGHESSIDIWKTGTWEHEGALAGPAQAIEWAPDGRTLVAGQAWADAPLGNGHWTTTLWDLQTRKPRFVMEGPKSYSLAMALSPNGKLVATAGAGQSAMLWDAATGTARFTLPLSLPPPLWIAGWPLLVWHPNSEMLAAANSGGGGVRLWSAATGQMIAALPDPKAGLRAMAWSPDGRTLAAGWDDGAVSLRSAPFRQPRFVLRGHTGAITSLDWKADGQILASASDDGSVRLWRAGSGQELAAFYAIDGGKEWLTMTSEGYFVASPHGADYVYLRTGGQVRPLGAQRKRLERADLVRRSLASPSGPG